VNLDMNAMRLAQVSGDSAAVNTWGERMRSRMAELVAVAYLAVPSLRSQGMMILRTQLARQRLLPDSARPLYYSRPDWKLLTSGSEQRLFLTLGRVLMADGNLAAATDTLEKAAALGWNVRVFRALADAYLAGGDTTRAIAMYANVAADPETSDATTDSIRARFKSHANGAGWETRVARADEEMRGGFNKGMIRRAIPRDLEIIDTAGKRRRLSSFTKGRTTAVVFLSKTCPPCYVQAKALQQLLPQLQKANVGLVTLVDEPPSAELRELYARSGFTQPMYQDRGKAASAAFGGIGTPRMFTLDSTGVARFETLDAGELMMQIAVFQGKPLRLVAKEVGKVRPRAMAVPMAY
jgi:peroxiredoxin